MQKVGLIVRMDNTGLGNQTRALCEMLKPDRLLIVDSTAFNGNSQHLEWYEGYEAVITKGWPDEQECSQFMFGLTHLLTAETVYNNQVFWLAKKHRIKLFIQPNWEFLDHLVRGLPQPDKWLMPSYWHLEDMKYYFRNTVYLPPPIDIEKFAHNSLVNTGRVGKRRFLHVVGKPASHDRNGTADVLEALKHSTEDYELVIKSQQEYDILNEFSQDKRVTIDCRNIEDESLLYLDYDAVIFPRRYAGLSLPMNEALASSLPVIMPAISPNNQVLKRNWLVGAEVRETFMARTKIDVYQTDPVELGKKIDELATMPQRDLQEEKLAAFEIAHREFSPEVLLPKYKYVMGIR